MLLAAGQDLLEGWFPGLFDELLAAGAIRLQTEDVVWHQGGAPRVRVDIGAAATSMSRPLLEATVRTRLLAQCSNVTVSEGIVVERPVLEHGRVVGVLADGEVHAADLVVDCSGRTRATSTGSPRPATRYPRPRRSPSRWPIARVSCAAAPATSMAASPC